MLDILNQYQELDLVESKINDDGSLCLVVAQAHTPDALNFENDAVIGNKNNACRTSSRSHFTERYL